MTIEAYQGGNTYTTTVTASGSGAHIKGSYVQLTAATGITAQALEFSADGVSAGTTHLIDLASGAAGAESVVIANVMLQTGNDGQTARVDVLVPVSLASGTRLAARCQANAASRTCRVIAYGHGAWVGNAASSCATYGANTGTSRGTSVDPGGSADTKGSYSQITASTSATHYYLIAILGNQGNSIMTNAQWTFDLATGAGGAESIIYPDIYAAAGSAADQIGMAPATATITVDSGTRLAARSKCSITDATDRLLDIQVIGAGAAPSGGSGGVKIVGPGGLAG